MLAALALGMLVVVCAGQPPQGGEQLQGPQGGQPHDGGHPDDGGYPHDGGQPHDGGHHQDDWLNPGGIFYYHSWYSYPYYTHYTYPTFYYSYPYYSYPIHYLSYGQSCSVWTDKSSYRVGEIVTIYCNVPTRTTATFTEYMPDGSIAWQEGHKWIGAGTTSRTAQAWYPTGQRRIVLQTSYGYSSTNYFSVY